MNEIDKKLAQFLATLAPPGSGPEARRAVMDALATVLGMYLAGDLAKLGRAQYKRRGQELMDEIAGVAETSAVQLRPLRKAEGIIGAPPKNLGEFTSPPADMLDPQGDRMTLLSALGAVIDPGNPGLWQMSGWPTAWVAATKEGLLVEIPPAPGEGNRRTVWTVVRQEIEEPTGGSK